MSIQPVDICQLSCFQDKESFYSQIETVKMGKADCIRTDFQSPDYTLQYAPVGNYLEKPLVIICGKTTSGDSHDLFVRALHSGKSLHEACLEGEFY